VIVPMGGQNVVALEMICARIERMLAAALPAGGG